MILSFEQTRIEDLLLYCGAAVLQRLSEPTTVTALWERVQGSFGSFNDYCFAVDFLFCVGLVALEPDTGLLERAQATKPSRR